MSESARKRRRQRNLVTMKFNFINYLLETLSVGLFLFEKGPIIHFLYYVVNSCGTPLVYYLGIEENRMQAQDYFRIISISSANVYVMTLYPRSHIRVVKRSHVSPAPTISPPAAASQEASPSQPSHSSHKQTQGIEVRGVNGTSQEKAPTCYKERLGRTDKNFQQALSCHFTLLMWQ